MVNQSFIFNEVHSGLPREGPGDTESTRKAFQCMTRLPYAPSILDVGCGPGKQTLDLAGMSEGRVMGLDLHQRYLDELDKSAVAAGVCKRVTTICQSMDALSFQASSFDVIWSENAIYFIGFENGLRLWRPLLRANGYIAASEICWLTDAAPEEAKTFWRAAYPEMTTIDSRLEAIRNCGYENVAHFTLPESAWWQEYYFPMEKRLSELRKKYTGHPSALEELSTGQREIDLYRTHAHCYGCVFFIMQKNSLNGR